MLYIKINAYIRHPKRGKDRNKKKKRVKRNDFIASLSLKINSSILIIRNNKKVFDSNFNFLLLRIRYWTTQRALFFMTISEKADVTNVCIPQMKRPLNEMRNIMHIDDTNSRAMNTEWMENFFQLDSHSFIKRWFSWSKKSVALKVFWPHRC